MKQMLSSVSPKGQITIPLEIRKELRIKPKDKVAFRVEAGEVKIVPVGSPLEASFQAVPGLKKTMSVEEMTEIAAGEHAQQAAEEGL